MIILLGGESNTGKTCLAQKLMERYHIPYLSMDHIKMGLLRGQKDCKFHAEDADDVIVEHIWPILKGIIDTALENKQSLIIEGCYLPLFHLQDIQENYHKQIISFYLGFSTPYI